MNTISRIGGIACIPFVTLSLGRIPVETGSLCVAKIPSSSASRSAPGSECAPASRSLQIDRGARMPWPIEANKEIAALSVHAVHHVTILCDGHPIQSFSFQFSTYHSAHLCLYLNDLYWTPQLAAAEKQPHVCDCK